MSARILVFLLTVVLVSVTPAQMSFAPAVSYTPGNQPETTALGDFNGDGDLDAAVTSDVPDKITIHSNNGSGILTLGQTILFPNGSSPHFVVARDLDGDGDLDLALTLKNVNSVTVAFNNGGVFTAPGLLMPVGVEPRSMVAVNTDADADIDLVTSNRNSNTISILRNNGNGSFQAAVTVAVGQDPRHITAGDLDGDGDQDLAVANNNSNSLSILLNNGLGSFSLMFSPSTGIFDPEGITAVDLDGDLDLDLAVTGHDNTTAQNVVLIYLNAGGASFAGFMTYPVVGQDPSFIGASDLDLDGDLDLATANQTTNDLSVLANNGLAAFGAPVVLAVGPGPSHVTAGDLDGNQTPDLVATNDNGTTISVLMNQVANGTLSMRAPPAIGTVAALQISSPNDGGNPYVCAFAFGTTPGIDLGDGRHFPLNADALFDFSLLPNNGIIFNNVGILGVSGTATVSIAIPFVPAIVGQSIFAACAILNPISFFNVEQMFGPLQITFQ